MRRMTLAAAAIATLASAGALHAADKPTGEEQLAKILEGRVAGEPVSCIDTGMTRQMRIIDKTAIVYDAGSVIYVNRPSNPSVLDSDDILVTKQNGRQLCRLDIANMADRTGMWQRGSVSLGDFVPYRRPAAPQN